MGFLKKTKEVFGRLDREYAGSDQAFMEAIEIATELARRSNYTWVEEAFQKHLECLAQTGNKVKDEDFLFVSQRLPILWSDFQVNARLENAISNYTPETGFRLASIFVKEFEAFPTQYVGPDKERANVAALLSGCVRICILEKPYLMNTMFEVVLILWCHFLNLTRGEVSSLLEFTLDLESHSVINPPSTLDRDKAKFDFFSVLEGTPESDMQISMAGLSVPQQVEDALFRFGTVEPSFLLIGLRPYKTVHGLAMTRMIRLVAGCYTNLSSQLDRELPFDDVSLSVMNKVLEASSGMLLAIKDELISNENLKGDFYEPLKSVVTLDMTLRELVLEEMRRTIAYLNMRSTGLEDGK